MRHIFRSALRPVSQGELNAVTWITKSKHLSSLLNLCLVKLVEVALDRASSEPEVGGSWCFNPCFHGSSSRSFLLVHLGLNKPNFKQQVLSLDMSI